MIRNKMNRLLSAALFLLLASPALAAPTTLVNGKVVTVNADFAIAEVMLSEGSWGKVRFPTKRRSPSNPMSSGQRPQTTYHTGHNVPVPSRVQGPVTFGDNQGEENSEDGVAVKAYNGATDHWCSWRGPSIHEWHFNDGPNNYVEAVCNQIDQEP